MYVPAGLAGSQNIIVCPRKMNPQQLKTWRTGLYRVLSLSTAGVVGRKGFECGVPACSARRGRTVGRRTYGDRQGLHFPGRKFSSHCCSAAAEKKKCSSVLVYLQIGF
jgi:hypothetical protein